MTLQNNNNMLENSDDETELDISSIVNDLFS